MYKMKLSTSLKPQYLIPPQPNQLPETGFVRLWQITGSVKRNIPPLLPIGRTTFLNGVKSGKYPRAYKLGIKTTCWKVEDIRALIVQLGNAA
jgi:predicted DNA-binding transcriptional regulator AlpA